MILSASLLGILNPNNLCTILHLRDILYEEEKTKKVKKYILDRNNLVNLGFQSFVIFLFVPGQDGQVPLQGHDRLAGGL